jgi:CheY-like chemotaxis protein
MEKIVLLIDNDKNDHKIFQTQLCKYDSNIKFISAYNGKEGIELLLKKSIHYIFLNINMPEMNGIYTLKLIKKDSTLKHIPVIIYTASDGRSFKRIALDLGAVNYFTKPNTIKGMRKLFENVLGQPATHTLLSRNRYLQQIISSKSELFKHAT